MGDFNTKIGNTNSGEERTMGIYGSFMIHANTFLLNTGLEDVVVVNLRCCLISLWCVCSDMLDLLAVPQI